MHRLQDGKTLGGRYALRERIASGGMAQVWAADDEVLDRRVAVKVIRPELRDEPVVAARFRDEAINTASLLHTNIATVFDYGEDDDLAFIVMELVEGRPLSELIREQPLHSERVRSVLLQSALALGVAHEQGVVHRDVKPANILLRDDDLVKLTDFGIARALDASGHTRQGEMLGTPHYISPEQAMGEPATGASDLYALGVVAHEALSGRRPFDAQTPVATALCHVQEPPPPLPADVPRELAELVEDLLAKDPDDRPANAREVAVRLGLHDHELVGLSLGAARAVYGDERMTEAQDVEEDGEEPQADHAAPQGDEPVSPVDLPTIDASVRPGIV